MFRRLNLRLAFLGLLLLAGAAWVLSKEHRPSVLRPGVRMHAYITNTGDGSASLTTGGTVSVVDLVRLSSIATIAVGPAPSGVRAHPTRDEIWGVSTDGGYVWVIDTRSAGLTPAPQPHRIPVGAAPFAVDFSPDGKRAFVAASGSNTLSAIDCASQKIIGTARTGKRPWLARVTPDGKLVLVPNRDDSTVSVLDAATLATIATVPVAAHPESIEVLLDSKKAFVSAAGSGCHPESAAADEGSACGQVSVLDLQKPALLTNLSLGGPATDLVLKPDGGELYVPAPATHGLAILNTWTNEVTEQVLVGDAPSRGILTADANILYVTDAAAGRVLPIEITFRHVLPPIAVGRRPGVARFSPGEDLLLVVNEDSDDLAVIRVRTQSLLTLIPVGHRPRDIAVKVF